MRATSNNNNNNKSKDFVMMGYTYANKKKVLITYVNFINFWRVYSIFCLFRVECCDVIVESARVIYSQMYNTYHKIRRKILRVFNELRNYRKKANEDLCLL